VSLGGEGQRFYTGSVKKIYSIESDFFLMPDEEPFDLTANIGIKIADLTFGKSQIHEGSLEF